MIPLLRLLGMIAPIFGVLFFCFFGGFLQSIKNQPLEMPGVFLLFLVLMGSFGCFILSIKSDEKDRRLSAAWAEWTDRIRNFLFVPQPGPTGILVTRTPARVHLRLPDEYPSAKEPVSILGFVFCLAFFGGPAAVILFILHNNSQAIPPALAELRDFSSFLLSLPAIALVAFLALLGIRYNWHIELVLTATELRVYHVYAGFRWRRARIDLTPIRQFTVLRRAANSSLQAESVDDPPDLLLHDRDHDRLLELANLVARERSVLDPVRGATRVAVESLQEIQSERLDRPLHSKIVLTRHGTGITLDFPLAPELRGLAVAGNLLIRTFRDHRKQIWYRQEIDTIALVEDNIESMTTNDNGGTYPTVIRVLHLVVQLRNGEKVILLGIGAGLADYRPKAELEWIATTLRQALNAEPAETPGPPPANSKEHVRAHAIQESADRVKETRISS